MVGRQVSMWQVGLVEADRMYGAKRQIVESLGFANVQVWAT